MAADDLSELSRLLQEAADQESEDPFTPAQWAMIDERLGRILRNYLYAKRFRRTGPSYEVDLATGKRTLVDPGGERISEQEFAWRHLDWIGIVSDGDYRVDEEGISYGLPRPGAAKPPDIEANRRAARARARNAGTRPRHGADEILIVLAEAFRDGVTGWGKAGDEKRNPPPSSSLYAWRMVGDRRKRLPTKKAVVAKLAPLLDPGEETLPGARRLIKERGL